MIRIAQVRKVEERRKGDLFLTHNLSPKVDPWKQLILSAGSRGRAFLELYHFGS